MTWLLGLTIRRAAWRRLEWALSGVIGFAALMTLLGYAAVKSYAAWLNLKDVDAPKIATEVGLVMGALGVAGAFFYLSVRP